MKRLFSAGLAIALTFATVPARAKPSLSTTAKALDPLAYRELTNLIVVAGAASRPAPQDQIVTQIEQSLRDSACWRITGHDETAKKLPRAAPPAPPPGKWADGADFSAGLLSRLPRRSARVGVLIVWVKEWRGEHEVVAQLFDSASGGEIWRGRMTDASDTPLEPQGVAAFFAKSLRHPPNMDSGCARQPELTAAPKDAARIAPATASGIVNLKNTHPATREAAAQALGQPDNVDAVVPLIKALDDAEPKVRATAALSLGKIGSPKAVNALVELVFDSNPLLRAAAARSLGTIGSDRTKPVLKELLAVEKDARVRAQAEEALKKIDDPMSLKMDVADPGDDNRW